MAPFSPLLGMQYLQRLGWSPAAAAGILGNLQQESGFNPTAVHDNGSGYGMAGWRDPSPGQGRKTALMDFAAKNGKDASDPYTQLDFLNQELRTSEGKVGSLLQAARTPAEAAISFLGFERPSGWSPNGDPTQASGYANRVKYAQQIAGGQGADTMVGGAGGDTMQTPVAGGNRVAGQGLLGTISPEVTQGLLAAAQPVPLSTGDRIGGVLSGLGAALAAAGSGNKNWGLIGGQAIQGAMQQRQAQAQQGARDKAIQGLAQSNPQLAALFALGGPETVGKVLAAGMTPQDIMNIAGRAYDPNTRQFLTQANPEYQIVQDAAGNQIAVNKLDPTKAMPIPGQQAKPPEYAITQDANGNAMAVNKLDPSQVTPIGQQQGRKPEYQQLNGRLLQVGPQGAQDITPAGMPPGSRAVTEQERQQYGLPPGVPFQVDATGKVSQIGGQGTTVNVNNAGETAYAKTAGEAMAKDHAALAGELPNIAQREQQIAQMGMLLPQAPQGTGAGMEAWLSRAAQTFGLGSGEAASKAEAVQSIIKKIIPSLRIAGSGTTSDRDMLTFEQSLPQLANTPNGNQMILSVMSRAVQAQRQAAEIANRGITGELTPAEVQKQLAQISVMTPEERTYLEGLKSGQQAPAQAQQSGGLRPSVGVTPQAIGGMSMDDLSRLDPRNLTEDQRAAAERRWDQLSGGANGGQ